LAQFSLVVTGAGAKLVLKVIATSAFDASVEIYRASRGLVENCSAVLELCIRAAGPVNRSILDVFRQNARVADTAEVRLLGRLTYRSDSHKLFENAQPPSSRLHFGEAQQWSIFALPFQ
jgi:hypothetical protein